MRHFKSMLIIGLMVFSYSAIAQKLAIVGGTLHTMGEQGSLTDKALLIDEGRIKGIVAKDRVPAGYQQIDANDKIITPGIIGAHTHLGLVEVSSSAGTVDATADNVAFSPLGAALDVSYAINPDSTLMAISRIEGVTSAATGMSSTHTLFQGQGAVISLADVAELNSPLIKSQAFMRLSLNNDGADDNGGSRAALWPLLLSTLNEAQQRDGRPISTNEEWFGNTAKADINALLGVENGTVPLVIEVNRVADIRHVIQLKQQHQQLKLVLVGAAEAWMVATALAENDIAVILDPESNIAYTFDSLGTTLANAGRLSAEGVTVAIGANTHNIRLATQHAGNAVANGLAWMDGLAALTINVAKIYGIDNDYGSLEAGKVADVVIWSADPLEVMSAAEQVFIHGQPIKMQSRQTKLRDRYMADIKTRPARYNRP
ncbi:amidohydrolase family protein [Alteromonadaceae bacterium BrNp21-10]|nr:amidohydrolase family protein [Alteromonadaceae bacterium BrNp21-10]